MTRTDHEKTLASFHCLLVYCLLSCVVTVIGSESMAQPPDAAVTLSVREKQWIKEHPVVLVGTGSEWAPFDFREKGIWQGLAKDYLLAVGKETGLQFDFTTEAHWDRLQQYLRQGEVDLLPAIYLDDKLAGECAFTAPYFSIQEYLVH